MHGGWPRNAVPGALTTDPGQPAAVPACPPATPASRSGRAAARLRAAPARSLTISKEPPAMPSHKQAATRPGARADCRLPDGSLDA
jgi:hypothetical protein